MFVMLFVLPLGFAYFFAWFYFLKESKVADLHFSGALSSGLVLFFTREIQGSIGKGSLYATVF
jgi:hypothetical protein